MENQISVVQAGISKQLDLVMSYQQYKEFMMSLTPKDSVILEEDQKLRLEFLKEEWVSRVKKDHWMDFVIFHDDILLGDD